MRTSGKKVSSAPAQRWVLALTSVAAFMVGLDILVVTTALTAIRQDLGASIGELASDAKSAVPALAAAVRDEKKEVGEAACAALGKMGADGVPDGAEHVNPNGGAIALGHPLGMSGARLATTAMYQLATARARYALCTMCIGVGQGIAMIVETLLNF